MDILVLVHAWLRWAVLAFGLIGAVRVLLNARRPDSLARVNRADGTLFMAALDLNWVAGAVLLAMQWSARSDLQMQHAAVMTGAVILGHVLRVAAKRGGAGPFLMALSFLAPLVVVLAGHMNLPPR